MKMISKYFEKFVHQWKVLLKDKAYLWSLLAGVVVFVAAYIINDLVSIYKDSAEFSAVGDFILEKVPTYNLEFLFVFGLYFLVALIVIYTIFVRSDKLPFVMKTYGILIIVRACFILMTQVGPPAGYFYNDVLGFEGLFSQWMYKNDLFFSGHTAIPFLAFLLFNETKIRWFFFGGALLMGATVLLMHVHYSIDVFAAFFITHGIYAFSDALFNKLNVRFKRRIKLYSLDSLRKRVETLREKRRLKKERLENDPVDVIIPGLELPVSDLGLEESN